MTLFCKRIVTNRSKKLPKCRRITKKNIIRIEGKTHILDTGCHVIRTRQRHTFITLCLYKDTPNKKTNHIQDLYIIFIHSFDTYREILCIFVVYVIVSLCMSLCVYVLLGEKVCVNIWNYVCSLNMLCSSYESCIFNCKSLKQRIIKSLTLNT